tara:strand:- start:1553 stop:1924 length:372 start_codon:yes stop_codon:yes gene_type:complete
MPATAITLIPTTSFGAANGNYDGAASLWYSPKAKADGYYGFTDGLHTVAYYPSAFIGTLTIQASLVTDPQATDWVDVAGTTTGDGATPTSTAVSFNFTGNFVWVRIKIDQFTAGAITKALYNY